MTRYYILFENYDQGLALHDMLDGAGIPNRIAPAPASARGSLCCGMSLLLKPEDIDMAKAVIRQNSAAHHSIVPVKDQLKPRRDRYC
jgi:hypothetical protein